jgi:hypothetical protein
MGKMKGSNILAGKVSNMVFKGRPSKLTMFLLTELKGSNILE